MGHSNPLSTGITTKIKIDILGTGHQSIHRFNKINTDKLESLIGNLNHSAHSINTYRYFLNQLRHLLKMVRKYVPQRLHYWNRQDLHIWINILQWVTEKVFPINNIVYMTQKFTLRSDACKYGINGYNEKVMAWQWYPPPNGMVR